MFTILETTEQMNLADSLKTASANIIEVAKSDPNTFFNDLLHSVLEFGLKVVAALAIYIIGAWLIKKIRKALQKSFTRHKTEQTLASFVSSLVSISLTVLLIVLTVSALGVNTTSLAALLAAAGVAIGMALSGTVQNFAGGIMILVFKPFKAGDYIEAQGYAGTVKDVTITATKIITVDNREVIIPNGSLANGNINNYSARPVRRVDWDINVEYDTDAQKCIDTLVAIAKADARVLDASTDGAAAPVAFLTAFNESTVTFTLRAWVKSADYWDVRFAVNQVIFQKLPEEGIKFTYPYVNVNVKNS